MSLPSMFSNELLSDPRLQGEEEEEGEGEEMEEEEEGGVVGVFDARIAELERENFQLRQKLMEMEEQKMVDEVRVETLFWLKF